MAANAKFSALLQIQSEIGEENPMASASKNTTDSENKPEL